MGLRLDQLGTEALSWRDLLIIIKQTPRKSAIARAIDPDGHAWGLKEHLLAVIADGIHIVAWQNGGGKKRDRPKPIPRPGTETHTKRVRAADISNGELSGHQPGISQITGDRLSYADMDAWLNRSAPPKPSCPTCGQANACITASGKPARKPHKTRP